MPARVVQIDLGAADVNAAVQAWHAANMEPCSITRFRVAEQKCMISKFSVQIYCTVCRTYIRTKLAKQWLAHECDGGDSIVSVEFIRNTHMAKSEDALRFVKEHAGDGVAYLELQRRLSLHVVGLFEAEVLSEDCIQDLYGLDLLHSEAEDRLSPNVKSRVDFYGLRAPLRFAPHILIDLDVPSKIGEQIQAWYNLLFWTARADDDGVPYFGATSIRVEEQGFSVREKLSVGESIIKAYHCTKCDEEVRMTALFPNHKCTVAVIVTFGRKLTTGQHKGGVRPVPAREALSCVKERKGTGPAIIEMWTALTKHCVDLFNSREIEPDVMRSILDAGLLHERVLGAGTIMRIKYPPPPQVGQQIRSESAEGWWMS